MNRSVSASTCSWNSSLQWIRISAAVASIALFSTGNLRAANLEKLEGSVSDIESKMNRARTQFVTNLESCVERIRRPVPFDLCHPPNERGKSGWCAVVFGGMKDAESFESGVV
jgi:hypothetical protein